MDEHWKRWRSCVRHYFRARVRDPHAVDDLVQETWMRAWLSHREGRVQQLALRWVLGIGWRVLADHRRAAYGRRALFEPASSTWCPEDVVAESRERTIEVDGRVHPLSRILVLLDECVRDLPPSCAALMRGRMEGFTMKELARCHGMTENVVKLRLYRGRRQVKQAMLLRLRQEEDENVVSSTG